MGTLVYDGSYSEGGAGEGEGTALFGYGLPRFGVLYVQRVATCSKWSGFSQWSVARPKHIQCSLQ